MRAYVLCSLLLLGCGDDDPTINDADLTVTFFATPQAATRETTAVFRFSAPDAATFTCALDGAAATDCTPPHTVTAADGDHQLTVVAFDETLVAGEPASFSWRVDTVPPDTAITSSPAALTNNPLAIIAFAGAPAGDAASFECRLDGADFASCATPAFVSASDGLRNFEVRAVDAVGNVDATPALVSFTVDTIAPTLAITSGPSGITPDEDVSFAFTAGADATSIQCSFDGGTFAACTSPFAVTSLDNGAHTFAVRVQDAATNTATATRAFTVDNQAPDVTITGPTITSDTSPTFTLASTTSPITFRCKIDSGAFAACTSPFTPTLTDGPHTLDVEGEDSATNIGSASLSFTIDSTPPTVTIVAPLIPAPPVRISDGQPAVSFTTADATTLVVECAIDTGSFGVCISGFAPIASLADGAHTYHVRATDEASNETTVDVSFTVDNAPPDVVLGALPTTPSSDTSPSFAFTVTGATAVRCELTTGEFIDACTSPASFGTLTAGVRTFSVIAVDDAVDPNSSTKTFAFEIATCGDGVRTGTEQCEGTDFGTSTCASFPPANNGTLSCTSSCTIDATACTNCGNGVRDPGEDCDGTDFQLAAGTQTATCVDLGSADGTLGCSATCGLDIAQCFDDASDGFTSTGKVCFDGIKFAVLGEPTRFLTACSESDGLFRNNLLVPTAQQWMDINGDPALAPAVIGNKHGRGIASSGNIQYFADPAFGNNGFRSNDVSGTTAGNTQPAWGTNAQGLFGAFEHPTAIDLFNARIGAGALGNYYIGHSAVLGKPVLLHSSNTPGNMALHTMGPRFDGTLPTGTARGIATNPSENQGPQDMYIAVHGQTPTGAPATGGIYWACATFPVTAQNPTPAQRAALASGGMTIERDNGISLADRDLVWSLTPDNQSATNTPPRTCLGRVAKQGATAGTFDFAKQISAASAGATTTATYTTTAAHGLNVGDSVDVAGLRGGCNASQTSACASPYNGVFTITAVPDATSFVTTLATAPVNGNPAAMPTLIQYNTTYYVTLRGGNSIYKTTNGGDSWAVSSTGMPTGTEVYTLQIDCERPSPLVTCSGNQKLWAGTSDGLWHSPDAGATWKRIAFAGKQVRAVALDSIRPAGQGPKIFVGVDDTTKIYSTN